MGAAKFCNSFRAAAAELLSHVKYVYFSRSIDRLYIDSIIYDRSAFLCACKCERVCMRVRIIRAIMDKKVHVYYIINDAIKLRAQVTSCHLNVVDGTLQ